MPSSHSNLSGLLPLENGKPERRFSRYSISTAVTALSTLGIHSYATYQCHFRHFRLFHYQLGSPGKCIISFLLLWRKQYRLRENTVVCFFISINVSSVSLGGGCLCLYKISVMTSGVLMGEGVSISLDRRDRMIARPLWMMPVCSLQSSNHGRNTQEGCLTKELHSKLFTVARLCRRSQSTSHHFRPTFLQYAPSQIWIVWFLMLPTYSKKYRRMPHF